MDPNEVGFPGLCVALTSDSFFDKVPQGLFAFLRVGFKKSNHHPEVTFKPDPSEEMMIPHPSRRTTATLREAFMLWFPATLTICSAFYRIVCTLNRRKNTHAVDYHSTQLYNAGSEADVTTSGS